MILRADAARIPLRDGTLHCVVTSPPYWGLRDYGIEGQLGLEATPEEYVAKMVAVFREVRRVLRDDGTLWLNLGDSYAGSWGAQSRPDGNNLKSSLESGSMLSARQIQAAPHRTLTGSLKDTPGLKPKDMVGIPWRVAFALQADGWWLRSDIIWAKPNPMPESVTDRPTKSHEYLFLLAKRERYYYDAEAIREKTGSEMSWEEYERKTAPGATWPSGGITQYAGAYPNGRNRRTVWEIATQPYPEAHFATFPEALVEPCVLAGTSEVGCCWTCDAPWERVVEKSGGTIGQGWHDHSNDGTVGQRIDEEMIGKSRDGTYKVETTGWAPTCDCPDGPRAKPLVLDPFAGSGTVGEVCHRLGRRFVGLELSAAYCRLAAQRTAQLGLV